jgi:Zn-dependent protease
VDRDDRRSGGGGGVFQPTISLGRIAGVPVGINWSWIGIFALIVWTLAAGAFPAAAPGRSTAEYTAMGVVTAAAFFTSLLLHELGHAVQARRDGVRIEGITLWLFGGVARMSGTYPSAGAELRIAAAGPLVSLVLGVGFTAAGAVVSRPLPVSVCLGWLGYINLALLAFNLVPAMPLDGGRILRAALWRRSGDFVAATRRATTVGGALAMLTIGLGILDVLAGDLGGLWLAAIGWFVFEAGRAEEASAVVGSALNGVTVGQLMTRDPITFQATATLAALADEIGGTARHTTYPLVDRDGRVVGLLPLRALAEVPHAAWSRTTAEQAAIPVDRVLEVAPDDSAEAVFQQLARSRIGRAIVVSRGRAVGILSVTDLARTLATGRVL